MEDRLAAIEAAIGRLTNQAQLGFGMPPVTRRVYCNRNHSGLWYFWNGEAAETISAPAVTGYARQLDVAIGEYKGKGTHNLELTLDCGSQWYILSAGLQSMFSRGLLLALGEMRHEHFQGPITVAPKAGNEEKVLLCSVWAGKTYIKTEWTEDSGVTRQCFKHAQTLIKKVNHA